MLTLPPLVVLGLDPSLTAYGWCAVDASGVVPVVLAAGCMRTEKDTRRSHEYQGDQDARRVDALARGLLRVLDAWPAAVVAQEAPAGAQGYRAAVALGLAFGVTRACLAARELQAMLVQAGECKLAIGGSRTASKTAVADGVTRVTGWCSTAATIGACEAEYDACAVALTVLDSPLVIALRQAGAARAAAVAVAAA